MSSKAQELQKAVNAQFGAGTLKMASDPELAVTYLPTGVIPFDMLLQGGLPFGRFIEIFGDYSTLKSYVGLCAIRECQKRGGVAALVDTEHAFDPEWAESIGVDLEALLYQQPENGEKAMDLVEIMLRGKVDLIVFDSIAATLPKAEQETQLGGDKNIQPARLASLMSLACRKLTAANGKTAILWINQTRVNVGVMFGSNEAIPGGKAMGFYSSVRVAFRKGGREYEEHEIVITEDGKPKKKKVKLVVGQKIRATLEKSKLNTPHGEMQFVFDHKLGTVDTWSYLVNLCVEHGLVGVERGYWWLSGETKKQRASDFRGRVTEEELMTMLVEAEIQGVSGPLGEYLPAKSKAVSRSAKSSASAGRASTRTAGQGASSRTVRTRKPSTK